MEQIKKEIDRMSTELAVEKAKLMELEDQKEALKAQLDNLKKTNKALSVEDEKLMDEIHNEIKKREELTCRNAALSNELARLTVTNAVLKDKLNAAAEERDVLREQLYKLQAELCESKAACEDLRAALDHVNKE